MSVSFVLALAVLLAQPEASAAPTHAVALGNQNFTLPTGFEIELAAGQPLVDRPIHADFDERGRLYVCESSGSNDNTQKQLADKPHWVVRLEDTDGDGRYDRRTMFAERLMFPEGMLWHDGSVYVAAPPSIWKLTDVDDDGVADRREEWFNGQTLGPCANDLHGPFAGPDGWIYWCKGRTSPHPAVTGESHVFRRRPEGGVIESVMTGGMDNPVELAFSAGGELFLSGTFLQHPAGGRRDGLHHIVYGGVYGKPAAVLDGFPRTGELLPILAHLGPAAPAGLMRYESTAFGSEYTGNLFTALFNLHKITRHVLTPQGAAFSSRDEDFLVSDYFDFHPTDVLEDADGSLLVIDTGGWYKLCCPSSQLWKPEALGAIYRIRRTGAPHVADPRGEKLDWKDASSAELAARLKDARPAVRRKATHRVAAKGVDAVASAAALLQPENSAMARCQAVWALAQTNVADARPAIRAALGDADETVRQAALHAVAVARDQGAAGVLIDILATGKPQNRRAAAEALGRLRNPAAVPALLSAAGGQLDRMLEHSVIFALIEIAARDETAAGLAAPNVRTRRAALLALGQMEGGNLDIKTLAKLLAADEPELCETAAWLIGQHPAWAAELAPVFERQLPALAPNDAAAPLLTDLLSRLASDAAVASLMARRLLADDATPAEKLLVLHAMSRSRQRKAPAAWVAALQQVLSDVNLAAPAIAVIRAIPRAVEQHEGLQTGLLLAAADDRLPATLRLDALATLPEGSVVLQPEAFEFVLTSLAPDAPPLTRLAAAEVLSKSKLDDAQLMRLTQIVRTAGPLEIERLVAPFAHGTQASTGRALAEALANCASLVNVRKDTLQKIFAQFGPAVHADAEALYRLLDAGTEQQRARVDELLALVSQGDFKRGQVVFNSQKAACSTCHAMGYVGGDIGPDLTKIGSIRTERDLLEAIVFPSASFVRSFEPVTVTTIAGKTYNGTVRRDSSDEVVLALNAKDTIHIARDDIDELVPGSVSIMPAGLDKQLTPQELADLVAFLKGKTAR